ncbi:hypothetical protein RhiirA1_470894 [Rhizophagus irregularis]|uniref:Uncharacterized protein n=1 Tax=Rhizophagus irregularis TaxID=588596 RepID=A0A2N0R5B9_9GLOM|nr:hypothetical protein RhiirA1_470894 [Rhizophagus irregularis]
MILTKEAVEEFDANNKRMKERLEKEDKTKRVNSETEMTDSFRFILAVTRRAAPGYILIAYYSKYEELKIQNKIINKIK